MPQGNGYRWAIACINFDDRILPATITDIAYEAWGMSQCGEHSREVRAESYEGRITTDGDYDRIGGLRGVRFQARLSGEGKGGGSYDGAGMDFLILDDTFSPLYQSSSRRN